MGRLIAALAAIALLSGCATVMNDNTQPLRIDTLNEAGHPVVGADCQVRNDKAHAQVRSGDTVLVRRSSKPLVITCSHPDYPEAVGHAVSRANAGLWGNLVLGGAVGAVVDHSKGTGYTYPSWVQLALGWITNHDRRDEVDSMPLVGSRVSRTGVVPPAAMPATAVAAAPPPPPPPPPPQPAASIEASSGDVRYVANDFLPVFDIPGGNADTALPRGTEVTVHGRQDEWALVTAGSVAGWVLVRGTCDGAGCSDG